MVDLRQVSDSAKKFGPETLLAQRPALTTMQGDCTMADHDLPSPKLLRKLLDYNPETGVLTWRERGIELFADVPERSRICASWNARFANKPVTCTKDGYLVVRIFAINLRAHRVVWAMHHGRWPEDQIDHVNHDRADNRLENLRHVGRVENARNMSLRHDSKSGVTGVSWIAKRQRWYASIWTGGRTKNLGFYRRKADAIVARKRAEAALGFHKNHGAEVERLLRQPPEGVE